MNTFEIIDFSIPMTAEDRAVDEKWRKMLSETKRAEEKSRELTLKEIRKILT